MAVLLQNNHYELHACAVLQLTTAYYNHCLTCTTTIYIIPAATVLSDAAAITGVALI
jgi:hypothetical protein